MPQKQRERPPRLGIQLISAHTRSLIYRALKVDPGQGWKGSRRGVKMEIHLSTSSQHVQRRVLWRARIGKIWRGGRTTDIRAAIDEIESQAAQPERTLFT
jgi:hypothetical protein